MEEFMESGQRGPKTELQKMGESIQRIIRKKYEDLHDEVSFGFQATGNPQTVRLSLKISTREPSANTASILNHFHEDIQEVLEDYGIDTGAYDIAFSSQGEEEQVVEIKSRK